MKTSQVPLIEVLRRLDEKGRSVQRAARRGAFTKTLKNRDDAIGKVSAPRSLLSALIRTAFSAIWFSVLR
jgi:hypothetical protein